MSTGFLFLVLVVVVAALIAVDVRRAPDESFQEHGEWQAPEPERAVFGASRDFGVRAEHAGTVTTAAPQDVGPRSHADGAGSSARSHRRTGTWSATKPPGRRAALKNWPARARLLLLVIIPAVAAVVATLSVIRMVSSLRSSSMHSLVSSVHDGAVGHALVAAAVLVVVLALALWFTIVVAKSVLRPLYRLRAGAVGVAQVRLPEALQLISESDGGGGAPPNVDPLGVDSSDEIGEVAHAFDQVQAEALRLAVSEAAIRGKLNAIFINVSRRSQTLVDRQIRLIDELEQEEQQPERRANLTRLDHLVTRMRRYSQNLLILAGHEPSVQPSQTMALLNVIRAAVSEVEEYERISLNVQPGIAVGGPAVNDMVHLLTELVENATSLSAADTPVLISGRMLASGGLLIDITDRGFGMSAEEMAHANWRLDNPPATDVTVVKSMGLSVVGRLAARHGVRIRLRQAESGGLTALVWLPNALLLQQEIVTSPGFSRPRSRPDTAQPVRPGRFGQLDPDRAPAE